MVDDDVLFKFRLRLFSLAAELGNVREAYYDCDGDALLFVVEQEGRGACHTGEHSCFFRGFGSGATPGRV